MRGVALLTACALLAATLLGGGAPFGRIALALGLPSIAAPFFKEPAWRGIALYRAGRWAEAAEAFTQARAFLNLGNAEAHAGRYAAALEAYDIAIAAGDADARANFDTVASYYAGLAIDPEALALFAKRESGPTAEAEVGEGNGRAAGSGDEVTNTNTMLGLAELDSRGRLGVARVFDDAFMVADERWLGQLEDIPGAFLKARINHEFKRRQKEGERQ